MNMNNVCHGGSLGFKWSCLLLLFATVFGQTPNLSGKWVGVSRGNAVSEVIMELDHDPQTNQLWGIGYGLSKEAGEVKVHLKGYFDPKTKQIFIEEDSFIVNKPKPGWRFCLTEKYDLKWNPETDQLIGYYDSRECQDHASVELKRIYKLNVPSSSSSKPTPSGCPENMRQFEMQLPLVFFRPNLTMVDPEYHSSLKELAKVLKACPVLKLEVAGYTDSTGSESYDKRLSLSRAIEVKQFLVNHGVLSSQLVVKGYGYSKPVVPLGSQSHEAILNRRVEFHLLEY